ncbi:hypothetical protein FOL47_009847 [Perkinsus chesapeaki]|uniref:Secreted protein n=1 Tax=Perkinsus chesapeaki TaxID=330153 RepID=A0A7J6L645_PERCH|nr:hypothetical protein FOL47_009847 [Perkinsus chesapeaki]
MLLILIALAHVMSIATQTGSVVGADNVHPFSISDGRLTNKSYYKDTTAELPYGKPTGRCWYDPYAEEVQDCHCPKDQHPLTWILGNVLFYAICTPRCDKNPCPKYPAASQWPVECMNHDHQGKLCLILCETGSLGVRNMLGSVCFIDALKHPKEGRLCPHHSRICTPDLCFRERVDTMRITEFAQQALSATEVDLMALAATTGCSEDTNHTIPGIVE